MNDGWLGYLIIGLVIAWIAAPGSWTNALWYAAEYRVGTSQVHVSTRPTDCDWGRAPLGDKGCYYNATVAAYNAVGDVVGGDNAPRYGRDTKTGKPIVSYDHGKTWAWFDGPTVPDLTVKTVDVEWVKLTD
jgi:hypothetical protein